MAVKGIVRVIRLSELANLAGVEPIAKGSMKGYCMVCGAYTEQGIELRKVFSSTFTEYNKLVAGGDTVCPYCYTMLKTADYRRKNWLMTPSGVRWLKREEVYHAILEPPDPPFALYATRTGKKQGFIRLAPYVAVNRDYYPVAWDSELVWVDRMRAKKYADIISILRGEKTAKKEMLQGCSPKTWYSHRSECAVVEKVRGDPLWRLMVWASP